MKHIHKKTKFAGANQASPPVFRPPKLGEMQYGASYSFLETLDLISDGPIQGLVNKNAEVVNGPDLLQGIYLNDSPVQVSLKSDSSKVNIADSSPTQADITGDITLTNFFNHLAESNPNDLIVEPTGQPTNFTGKAGLVAPDWSQFGTGNNSVHTFNTNSNASNGFVYGGVFYKQDDDDETKGKLNGTCVSVKNDFPRFGLFMGPEAADVKLVNQSGVKSVLERDTNENVVTKAKIKDYLIYSDLTDLTKSINTNKDSFASAGTITLTDGVYTFTNVAVNGFIQEVSNTDIVEDRVYRVFLITRLVRSKNVILSLAISLVAMAHLSLQQNPLQAVATLEN